MTAHHPTLRTIEDEGLLSRLLAMADHVPDPEGSARQVLSRFGSIGATLAASPHSLARTGVTPRQSQLLELVRDTTTAVLRRQVRALPRLASTADVVDYLHAAMADLENEQFRLLCLDQHLRLLSEHVVAEGSPNQVAVDTRRVIRLAVEDAACHVIVAHNHPSGDPRPSLEDRRLTASLAAATGAVGMVLLDHLIIARAGHWSFRASGALD